MIGQGFASEWLLIRDEQVKVHSFNKRCTVMELKDRLLKLGLVIRNYMEIWKACVCGLESRLDSFARKEAS